MNIHKKEGERKMSSRTLYAIKQVQWPNGEPTNKGDFVSRRIGYGDRPVTHPDARKALLFGTQNEAQRAGHVYGFEGDCWGVVAVECAKDGRPWDRAAYTLVALVDGCEVGGVGGAPVSEPAR